MRRLLLVLAVGWLCWWAFTWHRHAVRMAMLEGQSLGLDRCRALFVKPNGGK